MIVMLLNWQSVLTWKIVSPTTCMYLDTLLLFTNADEKCLPHMVHVDGIYMLCTSCTLQHDMGEPPYMYMCVADMTAVL